MKNAERKFCEGTILHITVKSAWLKTLEEIELKYDDRKGFVLSGLGGEMIDIPVTKVWTDELLDRIEKIRLPLVVYPRGNYIVGCLDGESVELVFEQIAGFQGSSIIRWSGFCPAEWHPLEKIVQTLIDKFHAASSKQNGRP